jgi:hypothetical protein
MFTPPVTSAGLTRQQPAANLGCPPGRSSMPGVVGVMGISFVAESASRRWQLTIGSERWQGQSRCPESGREGLI